MRRILITVGVLLFFIIAAIPYGFGVVARQQFEHALVQLELLANLDFELIDYKQGFFRSQAITHVVVRDPLVNNLINFGHAPISGFSEEVDFRMHHDLHHGPFVSLKGLKSVLQLIVIESEILDDDYKKMFSYSNHSEQSLRFVSNLNFAKRWHINVAGEDLNFTHPLSDYAVNIPQMTLHLDLSQDYVNNDFSMYMPQVQWHKQGQKVQLIDVQGRAKHIFHTNQWQSDRVLTIGELQLVNILGYPILGAKGVHLIGEKFPHKSGFEHHFKLDVDVLIDVDRIVGPFSIGLYVDPLDYRAARRLDVMLNQQVREQARGRRVKIDSQFWHEVFSNRIRIALSPFNLRSLDGDARGHFRITMGNPGESPELERLLDTMDVDGRIRVPKRLFEGLLSLPVEYEIKQLLESKGASFSPSAEQVEMAVRTKVDSLLKTGSIVAVDDDYEVAFSVQDGQYIKNHQPHNLDELIQKLSSLLEVDASTR